MQISNLFILNGAMLVCEGVCMRDYEFERERIEREREREIERDLVIVIYSYYRGI